MSDRIAKEDYADAAVSTHSADTTSVHGITDTSALAAIAALSPTNDDVIQRKAGAWTNRTPAQLIADLAALGTTFQPLDSDLTAIAALTTTSFGRGLLALADAATVRSTIAADAGYFRTFASGRYYSAPGAGVGGATTFTNQRQFFVPFHVPKSTAFDQIAVNLTVNGESGSKVRLGIYNDNGSGAPGSLVVDAGQVAVDAGATVLKTASINQTLNGLYWLSSCVQAAASTPPTLTRFENSIQITMAWLVGCTSSALGGTIITKDSVSGAFADPAGSVSATGGVSVPSIWLRAT